MLKIKDDVDLKELEKFDFTYFDDKRSYRYGCLDLQKGNVEVFINNARVISIVSDKSIFDLDIIYDLILNGLVEKVGR